MLPPAPRQHPCAAEHPNPGCQCLTLPFWFSPRRSLTWKALALLETWRAYG